MQQREVLREQRLKGSLIARLGAEYKGLVIVHQSLIRHRHRRLPDWFGFDSMG
jgi:hypothetical protein